MAHGIVIDPEYGYVLLSAVLLALEVIFIGFLFPGRVRAQVFNENFMKENFRDHVKGGYPDMGTGRFSEKLPFNDWLLFNNAQRAHMNFVETIASNLILILVAGIHYPMLTSTMTFALIIARVIYAVGYTSQGPRGRMVGALLVDLILMVHLVLSVISSVRIIQGIAPEYGRHKHSYFFF